MSDGNFKWWFASFEDSEYWNGPKDTRDAAIAAGGAMFGADETFWICEADKAIYSFKDLFYGDDDRDLALDEIKIDDEFVLIKWAETDEAIGEDGWDEGDFTNEDYDALNAALAIAQATPSPDPDTSNPRARALSKAFSDWAEPRREKFGATFMFGNVRVSEKITGKGEELADA